MRCFAPDAESSRSLENLYSVKDGPRRFQVFYATVDYSEPYGVPTNRAVGLSLKVLTHTVKENVRPTLEVNISAGRTNAVET